MHDGYDEHAACRQALHEAMEWTKQFQVVQIMQEIDTDDYGGKGYKILQVVRVDYSIDGVHILVR